MDVFKLLISIFILLIIHEIVSSENYSIVSDYEKLKIELRNRPAIVQKIPADLDRTTFEPFIIDIIVVLFEVVELNQIEQFMTIAARSYISWRHNGLAWDLKSYGNLNKVLLDTEDMWLPQIGVVIGNEDSLTLTFPDTMSVNSSGFLLCSVTSHITFRCYMDVRKYPFDTQTCNFGFYSFDARQTSQAWVIRLNSFDYVVDLLGQSNPYNIKIEWELLDFKVERHNQVNGSDQHFTVKIRRQRLYYIMVVIFPLVLTSLMIPLVFLIPKNSGEKISYLATIYTSTAIFLSYISTVMPKNLDSTPFLAILLMEVLCQGFCATIAALWIVTMYDDEKQTAPERPQDTTDAQKMVTCQKMSMPQNMSQPETRTQEQCKVKNTETNDKNCRHRLTGRQLDRFFFCFFQTGQILLITYLLLGTGWMD